MFDNVFQLNFIMVVLALVFVSVLAMNIIARLVSTALSAYIKLKRL